MLVEEVLVILWHNRSLLKFVGISIVLVAAVILSANLSGVTEKPTVPVVSEDPYAETPPIPPEPQTEPIKAFETDAAERYVLWEQDRKMIYVQNLQLCYSEDGEGRRVLYEWAKPWSAQAWPNGEFLLIGTQLIGKDAKEEGARGAWMAVRIKPEPVIVAEDKTYFGPQEVVTAKTAEEPRLYYAVARNGDGFSEYLFDPAIKDGWLHANYGVSIGSPRPQPTAPAAAQELQRFAEFRKFSLSNDTAVYAYQDDNGSLLYYRGPYPYFSRTQGYTLEDVKLISFPVDSPRGLGRFRDASGADTLAFLDNDNKLLWEPRLWEGDWQALNDRTFIRVLPEKLEVVRYPDYGDLSSDQRPQYASFQTDDRRWTGTEGTLAAYETNEGTQYLSFYDLVNSAGGDPNSLWLRPLDNFSTKQEPRPPFEWGYDHTHTIPEWDYPGDNTNASIPDALREAVSDAHQDSDYGFAKVYRKIGERWFVLVDRHFYEYKNGKLAALGDMPVTVMVRVGDGFGGQGPRDFVRADDSWIVADTEASRVIKLSDKLEVMAELAVPTPWQLTVKGEQVEMASTSSAVTADLQLQQLNIAPLPYVSTAGMKMTSFEYFWPQQWYEDAQSGLIWYYIEGTLYQYSEAKQAYRSFFIGYNENNQAKVRIMPHGDEVLVLMDRRLERFDRQGGRAGAIDYPRATPDGIYAQTPFGENSFVLDGEMLYLVQGYRILSIDLSRNEATPLFRQNYANIGKLLQSGNSLIFLLQSNEEFRFMRQEREDRAAGVNMYTEVVQIDLQDRSVQRSVARGYYDELTIIGNPGGHLSYVLGRYA